ncbi:MAG: hypothetical protein KDD69_01020 [Bdellovibrionales bacterium]|nr:hypothetical protein [Bdellovibrionales bacterium]
MWPRTVEIMLAVWLFVTPFVFRYQEAFLPVGWWWCDYLIATAVAAIALCSYLPRWRMVHWGTFFLGMLLAAHGWLTSPGSEPLAAGQNHLVTGLLLMMFGALPAPGSEAPLEWREFEEQF